MKPRGPEESSAYGLLTRSTVAAYGFAVLLALAALFLSRLVDYGSQEPLYAGLVGAVAVSIWYGGSGPGFLTVVVAWGLAPVFLYPNGSFSFRDGEDLDRWGVGLVVALLVVWVSVVMRRGQERAATAAIAAEESSRQMETLQEFATALSAAVSPTEVARVLTERAGRVIGAEGVGLALIEGDDLVFVELAGPASPAGALGVRVPPKTTLSRAVTENRLQRASDRETLVARYPDTAALMPDVEATLAVPVQAAGDVVGALGFVFEKPDLAHEEADSLASIIADLGGQALARARLYERERQARRALDRILRVAPRLYLGNTTEEVSVAICREARTTLGSDITEVWGVDDDWLWLELVCRDPMGEGLTVDERLEISGLPGLREAIESLEVTFVPDAEETLQGAQLEYARRVGIRSWLWAPIPLGGRADRILFLSWATVISEPDLSTFVLTRRFADQAGLAFEQLERRQAEEAAERRALETRRLLDVTAALAAAATPAEVTAAILRETVQGLGARGAVVVARREGEDGLEIVETQGFEPSELDPWRTLALDAPVPLADAVREGAVVTVESPGELRDRYPQLVDASAGGFAWLVAPLSAAGSVIGAVGFSYAEPHRFSEAELEFAEALGRQAGQALERARLLVEEHAARTRAEDMVVLASSLSEAATVSEIIGAAGGQLHALLGPDLVGVYLVDQSEGTLELVETAGGSLDVSESLRQLSLAERSPPAEAVRRRESIWLDDDEDWVGVPGGESWREMGIRSLCAVPLPAGERVAGVLVTAFAAVTTYDLETRRLIESVARQAAQPLERAGLTEREHAALVAVEAASRRTRRIQSVTQALAGASTPREVAAIVVHAAVAAVAGDAGAIIALDERREAPELLAEVGLGEKGFPEELLAPLTEAALAGTVLTLGAEPPEGRHERVLRDVLTEAGYRNAICLPLGVGPRVQGTLLVCSRSPDRLSEEDAELLLTVARIAAQALDRSRLFEREQMLRVRSERIQALTAALSGSVTQQDVADVVVEAVATEMHADASVFAIVLDDREVQKKLAWYGYGDELQEPWLEVPLSAPTPGNRALETRKAIFYETFDALGREFPQTFRRMWDTGHESFLFVPLVTGGKATGLVITSWTERITLSHDDRAFVESLASEVALALDRARRYEAERTIAETLQRSMLPTSLPQVGGVQLAARYLAGTKGVDVGGDWFDAIELPNGRLAFAVGDVVGKGVQAAAAMAQLRNALRAFAYDQMKPSSTVARLNRLTEELADPMFATVVYAVLDPDTGECRFTAAGHPPPLVVYPSGDAEYLEGGRGLPLGTGVDGTYEQRTVDLPVGSTLILYTDGLVERRGEAIDEGLERLRAAAEESSGEPGKLVEHVLGKLVGDAERGDDVALLVVRLLAVAPASLELVLPANRRSLDLARDTLRMWLSHAPVSRSESDDIVLAAWEACTNAIEHPDQPSAGTFQLSVELEHATVRVSVQDSGRWLPKRAQADRGLGLRLIRSLMSSVEIATTDEGTLVRLEKAVTRADAPQFPE